MKYKIINIKTGEPIKGPKHFNSRTKAEKYFSYTRENRADYIICKDSDFELESKIKYYDQAMMDLYHEIEITKNPETLMQLVIIMKDVLRKRRKAKNKNSGLGTSSIIIDAYKYRTTVLEDYGFFEEEEIYNW